jgi:hypothetical protein
MSSKYLIVGSYDLDDLLDNIRRLDSQIEDCKIRLDNLDTEKYNIEKQLEKILRNAEVYDDD